MRQVRVKPESFKYFHNSRIYYLDGIAIEPIIEEDTIICPKGSLIQFVFNSTTLGVVNLPDAEELVLTVEPIAREIFTRGRFSLRFTVRDIFSVREKCEPLVEI